MSKQKYVVDGDFLLHELYRAYILYHKIQEPFFVPLEEFKPELIHPLPASAQFVEEMEQELENARDRLRYAWQMLGAICETEPSRDRRKAADSMAEGVKRADALLAKIKAHP